MSDHRRVRWARRSVGAAAASLASLVIFADGAAATTCTTGDRLVAEYVNDGNAVGLEHRIALGAPSVYDSTKAQVLHFFAERTVSGGCGQDCQMQVGNILGRLTGPSYSQSTSVQHPYVEEYTPSGFNANIYFNLNPSSATFYNIYRTGIYNTSNYTDLYNAYFNNAVGSGNVLIGQAWLPWNFPDNVAQAEYSNIYSNGFSCPSDYNPNAGLGVYDTWGANDANSQMYELFERPVVWAEWTQAPNLIRQDAPYSGSWYRNYSAFTTWGR